MLIEDLIRLGLSEKEAQIYLSLLERGDAKAAEISRATAMQRPTVYDILSKLQREGFVSSYEKKGVLRYIPAKPDVFLFKIKEKQEIYTKILPDLLSRVPEGTSKPGIRFYDGINGVKSVFEETLSAQNKQLCGILSMQDLYEIPGKSYMDDYVARRVAAGYSLNVIRSKPKDIEEVWKTAASERRELRYAPSDMLFSMTTYLFDHKVGLISTQKEKYGLIIESRDYSALMRNLFEALWTVSERV
ncbi:MAG: helix-turn-helix domain-containing protein [bacterium]|nr:helix-turn-helix domain-containing protein [bacterium]